jgi:hypothetical protein
VHGEIQDSWRWDTEKEAIEGHDNWCITHLGRHADNGEVRQEILRRQSEAQRALQDRDST